MRFGKTKKKCPKCGGTKIQVDKYDDDVIYCVECAERFYTHYR